MHHGVALQGIAKTTFLPFHRPLIEDDDINAVVDVLKSGWLTTGPRCQQFEQAFAAYTGAPHAIAVSTGTAALHLALAAIGVGEGDEVIVPTLTFAATAEVVLYCKARPVLVDCEPLSCGPDPAQIERAITPKTRAIIPVHFAGHPCDMDPILDIGRRHGVKIIEDAAHALPSQYRGRTIGTLGDITCFSFHAVKTVTTGEGGMITTANPEYAERLKVLRLHGISKGAWNRYAASGSWRYEILELGYKYNLTDLQAALGITQLAKSDAMWTRRARLAARYTRRIASIDAFEPLPLDRDVQHAWHLYVVLVNPEVLRIGRDQVIEELKARGIGAAVHFIPLHQHPLYKRLYGYGADDFPMATGYANRCLSLPLYPAMTEDDSDRVTEALSEIADTFRR
jgi:dTDP-4-amino-4,6-dideoxygalactose transaminase